MTIAALLTPCCHSCMFVGDEVRAEVSFATAVQRLAGLAGTSSLTRASQGAWRDGLAGAEGALAGSEGALAGSEGALAGSEGGLPGPDDGLVVADVGVLARVGPVPWLPGLSKIVHVQISDLARRDGIATFAIRWQATGAAGGMFPVLDADITVLPDGERACLLGLDGAYRPPGGYVGATLDTAIMHRVATATIRAFLIRLADAIAEQGAEQGTEQPDGCLTAAGSPPRP